MIVARTIDDLQAAVDGDVTLVPTMGALHAGHASLIDACDLPVVLSIFTNPLQFENLGDCDDYRLYPHTLDADLELAQAHGVSVVFAPSVEEMYPHSVPEVWVRTGSMGTVFEGAARPGHFDGVATVVSKLFHLVQPRYAMFGQKDAQQVAILRRMVYDLNLDVEIRTAPIVRAADGLAESSRNQRLSAAGRERALALPRALAAVRDGMAVAEARKMLSDVDVDYFTRIDSFTFTPANDDEGDLAIGAIYVDGVRLIDNVELLPNRAF